MAKEKKSKTPVNNAGRPTGSYSSYGTSGYGAPYGGYGSAGNGAPYGRGPSPYGSYGVNNGMQQAPMQQQAPAQAPVANDGKGNGKKGESQKDEKLKGKAKKLKRRQDEFQPDELKYYRMTVGAWIGTFILLAIPIINGICAICWLCGVGNKSRTSWVRAYIVISLLIVLILGILFGVGYAILSKNAKKTDMVIDGQSYGKMGDYKFKGTVYYVACKGIGLFKDQIGGDEGVEQVKAKLVEILKIKLKPSNAGSGELGSGELGSGELGSGELGSGELEGGGEVISSGEVAA